MNSSRYTEDILLVVPGVWSLRKQEYTKNHRHLCSTDAMNSNHKTIKAGGKSFKKLLLLLLPIKAQLQ